MAFTDPPISDTDIWPKVFNRNELIIKSCAHHTGSCSELCACVASTYNDNVQIVAIKHGMPLMIYTSQNARILTAFSFLKCLKIYSNLNLDPGVIFYMIY